MAKREVYRVTPTSSGDWKVKRDGTERADSVHGDKADAVDRAKDLAKSLSKSQIVIHGKNMKIQTEHTYGKDPYPPKG